MTADTERPTPDVDAVAGWRNALVRWTLALFLFLGLSGIVIWVAPASAYGESLCLLHTLLGVAFLLPATWYVAKHLVAVIRQPLSHVALLGWTGAGVLLVCVVSGCVVTVEAAVGPKVSYAWDLVHTASGIACTALVVLHCAFAAARFLRSRSGSDEARAGRVAANGAVLRAFAFTGGAAALAGVVAVVAPRPDPAWEFPADYGARYGERPFAPSLATTRIDGRTDVPLSPAYTANSKRCGTSGCHEEITHEWGPSAHRWASRSMFFQAIQGAMAQNNGPESTRYCAGCHDPIALFSGSKNIYQEDLSSPGADEGVSCVACHSIVETDVKGNAAYVLEPQHRVLFEDAEGPLGSFVADFLIRSLPRAHRDAWSRDLLRTPEFCGACHKQFIDEQINGVGWVQLQNQYDHWRKSHWFKGKAGDPTVADPETSISCRECHMRLSPSRDPGSGDEKDYNRTADDGKHRNHRFIGANQWHPVLHGMPGGEEQVALTETWLRGESPIPEIASKWVEGPAVPIEIVAPRSAAPGEKVPVQVVVTSHKVGHDFPTGPLDIIQSWVELTVTDARGAVVFRSGEVDDRGYLTEGAFIFKAEGIDRQGNLIDKHNLWEMVGARFKRSLFPGFSDTAEYRFTCPTALTRAEPLPPVQETKVDLPADVVGPLRVKARLLYRKVDQTLIDFVFPGKGLTAPITEVSTAEAVIAVGSP